MRLPRASGLLLHVSSLPARHGIGDLGPAAYAFVDFLEQAGQSWWQVLPVGPTGYGSSPYQSPSAFAGNPQFISLERVVDDGWLSASDLSDVPRFSEDSVDFEKVDAWKRERLLAAHRRFAATADDAARESFHRFRRDHAAWLETYALYAALKERHGRTAWTEWELPFVRRDPASLDRARSEFAEAVEAEEFIQWQFALQWSALKEYAHCRQVKIIGDAPIFVAHDSADVWANQDLFSLDESGRPTVVAGVPPDYFSATGQLWGNPLYRWDVLAQRGYAWWIARFKAVFAAFDLVRLDHFRGFEAYWEIPGNAPDAISGRWVKGPGIDLFRAAEGALGPLPLIAEDLGVITPPVVELRDELGAPGMRVLQFAFGDDDKASEYQPHNYLAHCVAYTGTHDNDTTVGWFRSEAGTDTTRSAEQIERERRHVLAYVGTDGSEIHWDMIRLAWESVADTAIAPLQDVLGLGSEARMNLPGTTEGNWTWRFRGDRLTPEVVSRLRGLTETFQRLPHTGTEPR